MPKFNILVYSQNIFQLHLLAAIHEDVNSLQLLLTLGNIYFLYQNPPTLNFNTVKTILFFF